jgi:hypothetical protein
MAAGPLIPGTRWMVDSAFPLGKPPTRTPDGHTIEVVLLYVGGDTPHPWTNADIAAMPFRYRWPCWVRSNPAGASEGTMEAGLFASWLHGHHVPMGTAVILDLETAVATAYVNAFNSALKLAGFKVTKYGSESTIWNNPPTSGGTFVAQPGSDVLTTTGDTVARQYDFLGGLDLSILKDQAALPLWDTNPPDPPPPHAYAGQPTHVHAEKVRWTNATLSWVGGANTQSVEVYLADAGGKTIRKAPLGADAIAYEFRHLDKRTAYKLGVLAKPGKPGTQAQYVDVTTR